MRQLAKILVTVCGGGLLAGAQTTAEKPLFHYQEVMIPVRDGIHLQTVILTPLDQKAPLPILLRRTPYGVPATAPTSIAASLKELMADGYILVQQNLRGRFKSEGTFKLSSQVNLADAKDTNETTDAYDTIDWLVKNVPNHNGRVGIYGVSYDGLTAGLTLLHPHPALKAVSEQASPADQWMNDDNHRYGALRLSYTFEYAVMEQADKNENTHFHFDIYDTYEWYLKLGTVANINARILHNSLPYWNATVEHPNYDAFWKSACREWADYFKGSVQKWTAVKCFRLLSRPGGSPLNRRMSNEELDKNIQSFSNVRDVMGPYFELGVHCHWKYDIFDALRLARGWRNGGGGVGTGAAAYGGSPLMHLTLVFEW